MFIIMVGVVHGLTMIVVSSIMMITSMSLCGVVTGHGDCWWFVDGLRIGEFAHPGFA